MKPWLLGEQTLFGVMLAEALFAQQEFKQVMEFQGSTLLRKPKKIGEESSLH
jgi:hypothetical protein